MGIITILWEKWVEFRRDFYKITLAAMIAPLMYLVVFGMGIQTISHGEPYLNFLIPGVVSLTTMNELFFLQSVLSFHSLPKTMQMYRVFRTTSSCQWHICAIHFSLQKSFLVFLENLSLHCRFPRQVI